MSNKIILQDVRCSYVFVTPDHMNKDGKYSIQPLIPKSDKKTIAKINALTEVAAKAKWGDSVKLKSLKKPLRDGDEEREGEEYEGHMFLNANRSQKQGAPGLINRSKNPATPSDIAEYCYSGAYFNLAIEIYAFEVVNENGGVNKGVAAKLCNVMLRRKGDRIGGFTELSPDAEFAECEAEAEEDDFDFD